MAFFFKSSYSKVRAFIKVAFFFKLSYSKVRAFYLPRQGRPSLVDAYIHRVQCFVCVLKAGSQYDARLVYVALRTRNATQRKHGQFRN